MRTTLLSTYWKWWRWRWHYRLNEKYCHFENIARESAWTAVCNRIQNGYEHLHHDTDSSYYYAIRCSTSFYLTCFRIVQHIKNEIKNALVNASYASIDTTTRWTLRKYCVRSIVCIAAQWQCVEIAAGIIIALRYYRTWFYYHIMAIRGLLIIVFVWLASCLPCLQFTMFVCWIFILCCTLSLLYRFAVQ